MGKAALPPQLGSAFMSDAVPQVSRLASWLNERTKGQHTPATFYHFHRWAYLRSGGRLGHGLIGAPSLVLITTGRRSQRIRATVLACARDGDSYVVTASNDGLDADPAWLLNLEAAPQVTMQVARRRRQGTATVVRLPDPDYPRLWELVNAANHDRYTAYQARTGRPIPLVIVQPDAVLPPG
jgi:F420H(2)-dependent quinone reductase